MRKRVLARSRRCENYSFIYTQVFGLVLEFCGAGGQVHEPAMGSARNQDFAFRHRRSADDVDAMYLGLGGADAVNFLNQYSRPAAKRSDGRFDYGRPDGSCRPRATQERPARHQSRPRPSRHLGGSGLAEIREGLSGPFPESKRFRDPSLLATNYYGSTMALIQALRQVNGDSATTSKYKEALAKSRSMLPTARLAGFQPAAIGTQLRDEVVDDGKARCSARP